MRDVDQYVELAAAMPLPDAAYFLYISKSRLDREERNGRVMTRQESLEDLKHPLASTLARLKCAHPEANDEALNAAIGAGTKLDVDCHRASMAVDRTQIEGHEAKLTSIAIDIARQQNPGFSETTYKRAWRELRFNRMW
jgi:hypothetical protein